MSATGKSRLAMTTVCPTCGCRQQSPKLMNTTHHHRQLATALCVPVDDTKEKLLSQPTSDMEFSCRMKLTPKELRRQLSNREQHIVYLEEVIRELHQTYKRHIISTLPPEIEKIVAEIELKSEASK